MLSTDLQYLIDEYRVLARLFAFLAISSTIFLYYRKWMNGPKFDETFDGTGKLAMITGADTNIGKEIALGLARKGLRLILASENFVAVREMQRNITEQTGNEQIEYIDLNLASFTSTENFVKQFRRNETRLDYLIHADITIQPSQCMIDDQLKLHVGSNYYGQFLLTFLLYPMLRLTRPSRIIFISSKFHHWYRVQCLHEGARDFCQNSFATILGAKALANNLLNSGVTCNVIDPGASFDEFEKMFGCMRKIPSCIKTHTNNILLKSAESRANTVLRALLDFSLQNLNGTYYHGAVFSFPSELAHNDKLAEIVWKNIETKINMKLLG